MAKINKICCSCGRAYSYCPSCNTSEPSWKAMCCSEACKDIYTTLSRNGVGLATAKETLDALATIEMPANLQPNIQAHIDRLKAEVKPAAKQSIVVEQPANEEIKTEETQVVEPVKSYRKYQKKVQIDEEPSQE